MPIYAHGEFIAVPTRPGIRARPLVGPEHGVTSFFVQESWLEQGAYIPLHTHPVDEALVVTDGCLTVEVGAETHLAPAGSTVVIPPGAPHRLVNHGPAPVRMLAAAPWNHATFYREGSVYLEGEPRQ
ncbi:MAG TPA: cupin domain-containing protein [Chloroflexota bacterium]|nr:cupin domain-containing protein [Chloroflexota bacterium]